LLRQPKGRGQQFLKSSITDIYLKAPPKITKNCSLLLSILFLLIQLDYLVNQKSVMDCDNCRAAVLAPSLGGTLPIKLKKCGEDFKHKFNVLK
jgi:hypothetical protein